MSESQTPSAEEEPRPESGDAIDAATLEAQLAEANDRVLRAQAELENFRRRARREIEDERQYATLPLLQDLLPVVDNLQRAIESAEQAEDVSQLVDGIQMVASQLTSTLERHHCQLIAANGQPFDPNLHEAIAQVPSDEYPEGTVVEEVVTGYRLHDRVIRASQVLVSRPASDAQTTPTADTPDDQE